jgi:hypothetical protein
MYSPGRLRTPDRACCSIHGALSTGSRCVLSASPRLDSANQTFPDRDQFPGPGHNHPLAYDTSEQRGKGGQARVGPWRWSRKRCHGEGQAFSPQNFPFDAFLILPLDRRIGFQWPTWSGETQECLCVSRFVSIRF